MAHGINIIEQATSVTAVNMPDSALPVIFGTAPINMVENKTVNEPVLCLSYADAVKNFGMIKGNTDYSLCQAMEVLYSLYGIQKAVFVNVLDPEKHKKTQSEIEKQFNKGELLLEQIGILPDTLNITKKEETVSTASKTLKASAVKSLSQNDWTAKFNDDGNLTITLSESSAIGQNDTVKITYDYLDASMVTADDITGGIDVETGKKKGLEVIADVFPVNAVIPSLILAPGFSHMPGVAKVMATKCKNINGVFNAVAIADIDDTSIKTYQKAVEFKNNNSINDPDLFVCFPRVTNAGATQWLSTHTAGVIAVTDLNAGGTPQISPSNQQCQIDGLINNNEVMKLGLSDANYLNENGIVTALNFSGGFKIWGNRTSVFPSNTDVKDMFIPVRRVFRWVANTIVTNFWQKIDIPATKRNIDNIMFTIQTWVDGLASAEVLLGGTVTFPEDINPVTDLLNGKFKFKLSFASPVPMEDITFILEFDVNLLNNLF